MNSVLSTFILRCDDWLANLFTNSADSWLISWLIRRKFEDAAETAFAQKSEESLDLVLGKCASSNRPLANRIQEMKAHLRQRR